MRIRYKRVFPHLKVENFGPIKHADVTFGDLTVFVGPQATGKSILLQLAKLLVDTPYIKKEFYRAGVDWEGKFPGFLDVYFGEGMHSAWSKTTRINFNGAEVDLPARVEEKRPHRQESMFLIPAQRVLALRDGWPRRLIIMMRVFRLPFVNSVNTCGCLCLISDRKAHCFLFPAA